MVEDEEASEDERAVELTTIAAIFPELIIDSADPFGASIELPVSPVIPLPIRFSPAPTSAPPAALPTPPSSNGVPADESTAENAVDRNALNADDVRLVSHLPPLLLHITLPQGYPTQHAPLLEVESESSWLPKYKLDELRNAGQTLWEEMGRDQVVFAYIDYLQQQAEDSFGLMEGDGNPLEISQELEISLLDFDSKAKRAKFEQETFECGVCLGWSSPVYPMRVRPTDVADRTEERCGLPSSTALLACFLRGMSARLLQFLH